MAEHTKGPWHMFANSIGCGASAADGIDVAHCHGHDTRRSRLEEEANARLIAAAPDLLAALDNLVDFCEQVFVKPNECDDIIAASAAIHLAKHGAAPATTNEEAA